MDIPDFVPNKRREDNLKKGGWRKYGRTASLSSSSETSASNSSDDEKELVFHTPIPGKCEDLSDACAGLDKLDIQHRRVRFSEDAVISKNTKAVHQDGHEMPRQGSEEKESTPEDMKDAGDAGGGCDGVDNSGNTNLAGEKSECGDSNIMQNKVSCFLLFAVWFTY
jgi:hypothetical protein